MPTQIRSQPTHRNRLSHKGLLVTQTRLFRNARLICVLGALAAPGFQTITVAQTAPPRGPSQTQERLGLSGGQSAASQGERITHLIRRGETLTSISRRYGTTVAAVQAWNGAPREPYPGRSAAHHPHRVLAAGRGVGRRNRNPCHPARGDALVDLKAIRHDRGRRASVERAPRKHHPGGPGGSLFTRLALPRRRRRRGRPASV